VRVVLVAVVVAVPVAWARTSQAPVPGSATLGSALFDAPRLLQDLKTLSADDMEGRVVGTPGGAKARAFVVKRFADSGLTTFGDAYTMAFTFGGRGGQRAGVNVVGKIDGTIRRDRYIVVSAHYDHIPPRDGQVSNGADDNASGTAALFAAAGYFKAHRPATSIVFAAFDAEEAGLQGSKAFVSQPPVPVESIVVNVNLDMIGRDPANTLFAVGVRFNPFLKPYIERVAATAPVALRMGHDGPGGTRGGPDEDWTDDSDHASFRRANIPAIYLGVEDFDQHHQITDDYETMTHDFYVRAVETAIALVKEFDAHAEDIERAHTGR
jgi:hypothetical protein